MEANTNSNSNPSMGASAGAEQRRFVAPPVDVLENKDELVVYVDVPGVKKDDVSIRIDKDQLVIEARRAAADDTAKRALMTEYRPVSLRRQFAIQQGSIEVDRVTADLQNGVLRLTLPKAARLKPRVIPVTAS